MICQLKKGECDEEKCAWWIVRRDKYGEIKIERCAITFLSDIDENTGYIGT